MRYLVSIFFLLFIISCGHVETHKDYYQAEQTRFTQQATMMAAIAQSQKDLQAQQLQYASSHPLVQIINPDGTSVTVNQSVPAISTTSLEHVPVIAPAIQPREAPGEKAFINFTDKLAFFGLGWLLGDTVKSGFENAGHNTTTTAGTGISTNTIGGDVSIPTTTTTTTSTETMTGSTPTEPWPTE